MAHYIISLPFPRLNRLVLRSPKLNISVPPSDRLRPLELFQAGTTVEAAEAALFAAAVGQIGLVVDRHAVYMYGAVSRRSVLGIVCLYDTLYADRRRKKGKRSRK